MVGGGRQRGRPFGIREGAFDELDSPLSLGPIPRSYATMERMAWHESGHKGLSDITRRVNSHMWEG